jgi:L-cysteine/cystine lyase
VGIAAVSYGAVVSPFLPDADKLAAVRAALPAVGAGIYLNAAVAGPLPSETAAAMAEIAEYELRVGRGHRDYREDQLARLDEARAAVASVLGGSSRSVALVHGAADGIELALGLIDWGPGGAALACVADDPASGRVVRRLGPDIEVVTVDVTGATDEEAIVGAFDVALSEATRAVVVSHVLPTTGETMPVARIAAAARRVGAIVVVDGSLAAGAVPVDVELLGADAYVVSAEKWLLGPEGIGAVWVGQRILDHLKAGPDTGASELDRSTFHAPSVVGFGRSVGWLAMLVGWAFIHSRVASTTRALAGRLARIPGVRVLTPPERMAAIVAFAIEGWPADRALTELEARAYVIADVVPAIDAVRLSVGFYTSDDEVERVAGVVELVATHTPETIPAVRRLTILGAGS